LDCHIRSGALGNLYPQPPAATGRLAAIFSPCLEGAANPFTVAINILLPACSWHGQGKEPGRGCIAGSGRQGASPPTSQVAPRNPHPPPPFPFQPNHRKAGRNVLFEHIDSTQRSVESSIITQSQTLTLTTLRSSDPQTFFFKDSGILFVPQNSSSG
jgi:hypothetical protein